MSLSKEAALPAWGYAVAGATGAVLANTIVYPLDIVKTRLQVQVKRKPASEHHVIDPETLPLTDPKPEHYASTLDALQKIIKNDGYAGLYAGLPGSLLGVASTNYMYFYWYTFVRTYYQTRTATASLSTVTELSLGAIAGALAQLFTIPVAVVTTRQQTSDKASRKDLISTAKDVVALDGVSGLWSGLKASLVLVVNPAITYGAYQKCKDLFFPGKKSLSPLEAFFLGALSKAMATFATQPLIVAKVGLQSKPPPGHPRFKSFVEVMRYIVHHEGALGLYKGIGPQLTKALIVQGLLMMTKERVELMFILLFRWFRRVAEKKVPV